MKHSVLLLLVVIAASLEGNAERSDYDYPDYSENSVYTPVQRHCPITQCRPGCRQYLDGNGCTQCRCFFPFFPSHHQFPVNPSFSPPRKVPNNPSFSLPQVKQCAAPNCPSNPQVKCSIYSDKDGCPQCLCQLVKPRCPTPQCSRNCVIVQRGNGCPTCKCAPRLDCPALTCPPGCNDRYMGPDGCQHCDCGDEVAVCPEVFCDFTRCRHRIDQRTGCAVGCDCYPSSNDALYFRG